MVKTAWKLVHIRATDIPKCGRPYRRRWVHRQQAKREQQLLTITGSPLDRILHTNGPPIPISVSMPELSPQQTKFIHMNNNSKPTCTTCIVDNNIRFLHNNYHQSMKLTGDIQCSNTVGWATKRSSGLAFMSNSSSVISISIILSSNKIQNNDNK